MRYLFFVLFLASTLFAFKYELSSPTIANGKTLLIKFEKDINIVYEDVEFLGHKYQVFDNYVLVPVSYYEKPKTAKLKINYTDYTKPNSKIIELQVLKGDYKQEKIKVQKSKVSLSKKDKKRSAKEYKEATDIYNTITPEFYIKTKFIMPLNSKVTSLFGNARVYNGSLKGYHSGTDFRAKVGTPLIATNDGRVVLAKDRFYSGGSIILDHGHGIYTCYYHMSKFDVKVGDIVKKGQLLGLSGVSGRVTGPHLHFSARVGGIQVDPIELIEFMNKNILRK